MNPEKPIDIPEIEEVANDAEVGGSTNDASVGKKVLSQEEEALIKEKALKRAKEFVSRYQRAFANFAGDSSLSFIFDEDAKTFAFAMPGCRVIVPLRWMRNEKYSFQEMEFVGMHELSHFMDMRDDPEGYLANFERMRKKSKRLARARMKKHPEKNYAEDDLAYLYYEQLHDLYNCLDDVYVNSIVTSKVPFFEQGGGQDSVISLYEKLGFSNRDLTGSPLHRQMAFALLGDEMVGEKLGMSKVDPRVERILSTYKAGKSRRTWVKTDLKVGRTRKRARDRYEIIKRHFENDYVKLVEEWIDELPEIPPLPPPKRKKGEGEEEGDEEAPLDPNSPSTDDAKRTLKKILEDKKNSKKTQEQKNKEAEQKKLEEKGIDEERFEENEEILDEISGPRREMQEFWQKLIGKSIERRRVLVQNQLRGEPSAESITENWDDFAHAQQSGDFDSARIYEDYDYEKVERNQPERIEVSLLVDCSGSMRDGGDSLAKKAAALLLYSLDDFNRELIAARGAGDIDSDLQADSQVFLFHGSQKLAKDFRRDKSLDDEKVDIINSVGEISSVKNATTNDYAALERLSQGITDSDREKIAKKKLKKIAFEITDGGSDTPDNTKNKVLELGNEGVLMIGFLIGDSDSTNFDKVWNNEAINPNVRAVHVGNNIASLPRKLMEQLQSALNDITI